MPYRASPVMLLLPMPRDCLASRYKLFFSFAFCFLYQRFVLLLCFFLSLVGYRDQQCEQLYHHHLQRKKPRRTHVPGQAFSAL